MYFFSHLSNSLFLTKYSQCLDTARFLFSYCRSLLSPTYKWGKIQLLMLQTECFQLYILNIYNQHIYQFRLILTICLGLSPMVTRLFRLLRNYIFGLSKASIARLRSTGLVQVTCCTVSLNRRHQSDRVMELTSSLSSSRLYSLYSYVELSSFLVLTALVLDYLASSNSLKTVSATAKQEAYVLVIIGYPRCLRISQIPTR